MASRAGLISPRCWEAGAPAPDEPPRGLPHKPYGIPTARGSAGARASIARRVRTAARLSVIERTVILLLESTVPARCVRVRPPGTPESGPASSAGCQRIGSRPWGPPGPAREERENEEQSSGGARRRRVVRRDGRPSARSAGRQARRTGAEPRCGRPCPHPGIRGTRGAIGRPRSCIFNRPYKDLCMRVASTGLPPAAARA